MQCWFIAAIVFLALSVSDGGLFSKSKKSYDVYYCSEEEFLYYNGYFEWEYCTCPSPMTVIPKPKKPSLGQRFKNFTGNIGKKFTGMFKRKNKTPKVKKVKKDKEGQYTPKGNEIPGYRTHYLDPGINEYHSVD